MTVLHAAAFPSRPPGSSSLSPVGELIKSTIVRITSKYNIRNPMHWRPLSIPAASGLYRCATLRESPQHGKRPRRDYFLNAASPEGIPFACMMAAAISADVSGPAAVRKASCVSRDSSLCAKYRVRR
jgi:hypothetical protein